MLASCKRAHQQRKRYNTNCCTYVLPATHINVYIYIYYIYQVLKKGVVAFFSKLTHAPRNKA